MKMVGTLVSVLAHLLIAGANAQEPGDKVEHAHSGTLTDSNGVEWNFRLVEGDVSLHLLSARQIEEFLRSPSQVLKESESIYEELEAKQSELNRAVHSYLSSITHLSQISVGRKVSEVSVRYFRSKPEKRGRLEIHALYSDEDRARHMANIEL